MKTFFLPLLFLTVIVQCGCANQEGPLEKAKDNSVLSKTEAKDTASHAPIGIKDTLTDQDWASIQNRLVQSKKMSKTQVVLPGEYDSTQKCYHFQTADDFPERLTVTGNWRYYPESKKIISFETEEEVE